MGFPGSGNSWIRLVGGTKYFLICLEFSRLLIDIATGMDTCADRVELHDDGEDILETEEDKINDVFRGMFDNIDSPHADDAQ